MPRPLTVTAIVAAYNEGDIIAPALEHTLAQGVKVYLLDHRSTDDTVARATPFLDRGLLKIERFPDESGSPMENAERFALEPIIVRKQALAGDLDSDWFINADADEFRESPWPEVTLR